MRHEHRQDGRKDQRGARRGRPAVLPAQGRRVLPAPARPAQVPGHDAQAEGGQGRHPIRVPGREHHVPRAHIAGRGHHRRRGRGRAGGHIRGREDTRAGGRDHQDVNGGHQEREQRDRGGHGAPPQRRPLALHKVRRVMGHRRGREGGSLG